MLETTLPNGLEISGRRVYRYFRHISRHFWVFVFWMIFSIFKKIWVFSYPHRARDALSPVCGIYFACSKPTCLALGSPKKICVHSELNISYIFWFIWPSTSTLSPCQILAIRPSCLKKIKFSQIFYKISFTAYQTTPISQKTSHKK